MVAERQRKIRIFQPDAYVSLDYAEQTAKIFKKAFLSISKKEIDIQKGESLKKEIEHFVTKVQNKEEFGMPDVPARDALALALRILESLNEFEKETKDYHRLQASALSPQK